MFLKIAKIGNLPAIEFAAEELKRCLTAMDSRLDISLLAFHHYDEQIPGILWLGVSPEVSGRVAAADLDDSYCIDVNGGIGSIFGSNDRSVLFGV